MNNRLKFEDFYQGEWDYSECMGVGLSFEGVPTDYKRFLDILMDVSCNPVSARRILDVLEKQEIKYVTVMSRLDFNMIGHALKTVGVVMKIVPPFEYKNRESIDLNEQVDFAVLKVIRDGDNTVEIDNEYQLIFEQRLIDVKRSLEDKPHTFGPYAKK